MIFSYSPSRFSKVAFSIYSQARLNSNQHCVSDASCIESVTLFLNTAIYRLFLQASERLEQTDREALLIFFCSPFSPSHLLIFFYSAFRFSSIQPSYLLIFLPFVYSSKRASINRTAFSSRGTTRSGPKMAIISKIPGLAVFPVSATLTGWAILPSLSPV